VVRSIVSESPRARGDAAGPQAGRRYADVGGTRMTKTPPTLLTMWYLAASLAERRDRLEYRHPLVAVRNTNNLVTGGLDIVRGEPAPSAIIQAAARPAHIPASLAGRLLSWSDAVEEHFSRQLATA
jgi:hypothetical protein